MLLPRHSSALGVRLRKCAQSRPGIAPPFRPIKCTCISLANAAAGLRSVGIPIPSARLRPAAAAHSSGASGAPEAAAALDAPEDDAGPVVVSVVQLRPANPKPAGNPSLWDFHTMFAELQEWHRRYNSTVVPRYVFDNPDLGQWVCFLRRAAKLDRLQKWQVAMLGRLRFNYKPTKGEAEWHHYYHELRRLKGAAHSLEHLQRVQHRDDVRRVLGWLEKQEQQLEKGNLSHQQLQMLRRLGVELRMDSEAAARYEQLDGLTARERRILRQRWKKERLRQQAAERRAAGLPPQQAAAQPRRPRTGKRSLGRG